MFKIARANSAQSYSHAFAEAEENDTLVLSQFTVSEAWEGDLSNGVIKLGARATLLHGLDGPECGLLSMMRCYEAHDRAHILELFEQAATSSSRFCYSTTIVHADGHRQPVFCIGESAGLEEPSAGNMLGLFVFPRFKLAPGAHLRSYG
ncbi:hypothetical protein [Rhizobium cremeum]|uniref:hypothetical protein n=1 Tax=Rhizobium cremeum TaxID=2813827 RepID=UPI000DD8866D